MEWKELPIEIQNLILERQYEQVGIRNARIFKDNICAGAESDGFTWEHTIEGHDFWEDILDSYHGKVDGFYEKYPETSIQVNEYIF